MAGITLETAEAKLQFWLDADEKLGKGQSVTLNGDTLTRIDAQAKIEYWDSYCKRLSHRATGSSIGRVVSRG